MEQKSELIERLKKGLAIMDEYEQQNTRFDKLNNKAEGLGCFAGLVIAIIAWFISFNSFDFHIIINFIISTIIAYFAFLIGSVIFGVTFDKSYSKQPDGMDVIEEQKKDLETKFRRVCGFSIDKYVKYQMHEIIDLLESGEADSFKEAASIIRSTGQHNQILEENRKLKQQLELTEKSLTRELKESKKELKESKRELKDIKSDIWWRD